MAWTTVKKERPRNVPERITIDTSWYIRPPDMSRERVSAGGAVLRIEQRDVFLALVREIDSKGHCFDGYVLPKGGLEAGETIEAGARREIAEEIGLSGLTRLDDLAILERQDANKEWWSINHYGLFMTEQRRFEITDVEHHFDPGWFPLEDLPALFWPDERAMLMEQQDRIRRLALASA